MQILGVRIDNLGKKEILQKIEFFLREDKFHQIATVNPEFILQAQKDEDFRKILNVTDLNVADGVGVGYAFLRHFAWLKTRIAGADLLQNILRLAERQQLPVFLAISRNSLSSLEEIRASLARQYPNLEIDGAEIDPKDSYELQATSCRILFCNFGAPMQEKFINSVKNDTIRLAMGVGGSFDFMTEKVGRAPLWMRKIGLEWLWRLAQEPRYRMKRIFRAVVIFPWRVLINS